MEPVPFTFDLLYMHLKFGIFLVSIFDDKTWGYYCPIIPMVLVNGADGTLTPGRCQVDWWDLGPVVQLNWKKRKKQHIPHVLKNASQTKYQWMKGKRFNPTNKISMNQFCLFVCLFVCLFLVILLLSSPSFVKSPPIFCCSMNLFFRVFWRQRFTLDFFPF